MLTRWYRGFDRNCFEGQSRSNEEGAISCLHWHSSRCGRRHLGKPKSIISAHGRRHPGASRNIEARDSRNPRAESGLLVRCRLRDQSGSCPGSPCNCHLIATVTPGACRSSTVSSNRRGRLPAYTVVNNERVHILHLDFMDNRYPTRTVHGLALSEVLDAPKQLSPAYHARVLRREYNSWTLHNLHSMVLSRILATSRKSGSSLQLGHLFGRLGRDRLGGRDHCPTAYLASGPRKKTL
jgi:hypothetical protein